MPDLEPVLAAVRQAAMVCRAVQQKHIARSDKPGREPVTLADYGSQAVLCRAISRAYPADAILAEEQGEQFLELLTAAQQAEVAALVGDIIGEQPSISDLVGWLNYGQGRAAERTWVIDPIDGTKGFLAQRNYTIAVGLLVAGYPVAGVLGSPGYPVNGAVGLLFYAQDGAAYAQPLNGGGARRIHVSSESDPARIRIVESVVAEHKDDSTMARVRVAAGLAGAHIEQMDGQDKYGAVACGDADLYLRLAGGRDYRHKVWDHAAGVAIVEAAGGCVTDIDGTPLNFAARRILEGTRGMVVTNGKIHGRVIAALGEIEGEG